MNTSANSSYAWAVAWLLVIVFAAIALQSKIGYLVIYYGLILLLVFVLVTQYQYIASSLAPVGQSVPTNA